MGEYYLATNLAIVFVCCLSFVIALVALIVVLRVGKGIAVTVKIEHSDTKEFDPLKTTESAADMQVRLDSLIDEIKKQQETKGTVKQASFDEALDEISKFMTGGN